MDDRTRIVPQPLDAAPSRSSAFRTGMAQLAMIGIFAILLVALFSYARGLFLPVTLALVIGTILAPVSNAARRSGIPHAASAGLLVLGIIGLLSGLIVLMADPVRDWIGKAPVIVANLRGKLAIFDAPLEALNRFRESLGATASSKMAFDFNTSILQPVLASLSPAAGQLLIFFGTLFFFLAHRETLRMRVVRFGGGRQSRLRAIRIWNDVETTLVAYVATVAGINAVVGVIVATFCYLVGMPSPLVWGALAFLLNFIPYIGPGTMILTLLGVGLVTFDSFSHALIAPGLFLAMTTIEGQFVTPTILGSRLTMSPLFIFLSVAFWAWLWGPFGALLAVPLLIIGMIVIHHFMPKDEPKIPG
jgi:predicted PurR-regulated permease PerM